MAHVWGALATTHEGSHVWLDVCYSAPAEGGKAPIYLPERDTGHGSRVDTLAAGWARRASRRPFT